MNNEMKDGMEMMLDHMRADYCGWSRSGMRDISEEILSASEKRYCDGLHYTVGQNTSKFPMMVQQKPLLSILKMIRNSVLVIY